MPHVVTFSSPGNVALTECDPMPLTPGGVRVRTWWSGISAGTELTAYRGTNPYLTRSWDAQDRLFREGGHSFEYPVSGWGYSEVGEVLEVGDGVADVSPGDVVYGIWGHRSEAVVPRRLVHGSVPAEADPRIGCFARAGAIALNAVLGADTRLGDLVAVFGQGVIGLLTTRLAVLSGAEVIAVDGLEARRRWATRMGASEVLDAFVEEGAGAAVRRWSGGVGVDAAIELSGHDAGLHEAVRSVVQDGLVVAAGFYQGGASHLRLGEEFHHNRVRIVASQIASTPLTLGPRWNQMRLVRVFMRLAFAGAVDVLGLLTHDVAAADVARAFERLDSGDPEVLQVLLRFDAAPEVGR